MKEVVVTLNRAHKLVGRMNQAVNELTAKITVLSLPIQITSSNVDQAHEVRDEEIKKQFDVLADLIVDVTKARNLIGEANTSLGISHLLGQKAAQVSLKTALDAVKNQVSRGMQSGFSSIDEAKDVVRKQIEEIASKGQNYGHVNQINVCSVSPTGEFSLAKLDEMLAKLKIEGYELDDKLSSMNGREIKLYLTDSTYSMLYS